MIYKRCPRTVFSVLALTIWKSLTPYVGISLSAQIVGELSGGRNPAVLGKLVLITLCSAACISLISALLQKWKDTEYVSLNFHIRQVFAEKMMDMDFVDVDDTKVHEKYNILYQNSASGGRGSRRVLGNVQNLLSGILTIFGGIALTVSLFTTPVPENGGRYVLLNHPLFLFVMLAVMLLITYTPPFLLTKAESFFAHNADSHNLGNRLWSHFGLLGMYLEYAADIRMYRQDVFCEKYTLDKSGTFMSKGLFAKISKGPAGLLRAAGAAVSVVFTGVVYLFVCLKALGGAFGIGSVTQYVQAITKVSGSLAAFFKSIGEMKNNAPFLRLEFEFLDIPNQMYQGSLTVEKRSDREYEIEFRDVSFQYPRSKAYALRHVNMKFRIGERLAVVGQNGSGKTTFIKLLCRLYDPTEGEILLNGIDIRKYDYREYLSVFSIVFQDFKLLAFSLGENVAAALHYDKAAAEDCLEKAGFGSRLRELPKGLETVLYQELDKEGVAISGGEAQKIALARTLYKDAPFLILDEPTAALDPVAEAEVYANFNQIAGDKTAIYISHRLSSCRFCDEIAVFDKGCVVQMGSHEALVKEEGGKYYELWNAQAQYYAE